MVPLLSQETAIQKEIDFFKNNNPNAITIMVSDDTMEPIYSQGDFVGGIQHFETSKIDQGVGQDCIIEISDGVFFRRLIQRKEGYALVCLNPQTQVEEPVIFSKKILAAAPVIWHRWKLKEMNTLK
jgi:SOS-response transcriptional repressor LexA